MNDAQYTLHAEVEETHWWFLGRRRILQDLVRSMHPAGSGGRLIDVGCGTGANIAAFAGDYTCLGIDPSEAGVTLARARFPDVVFVCGEASVDLGDRMAQADILLLTDVLEHVQDDTGFLAALVGAMTPGSRLLLTVPADMRLWSPQDTGYGHFRRYDRHTLQAVWQDLPVETELLCYFNCWMYPLVRVVRTFTRLLGRSWGERGTDLSVPPIWLNRLLERLLASERHRLQAARRKRRAGSFPWGVSLVAVLRRCPTPL